MVEINMHRLKALSKKLLREVHKKIRFVGSIIRRFDFHKPLHLLLAGLILFSLFFPLISKHLESIQYRLSHKAEALMQPTNPNLSAKLKEDTAKKVFLFNEEGLKERQKDRSEGSTHIGKGADSKTKLSASFEADYKGKVTVTDLETDIKFTILPSFKVGQGKLKNGRIIYPVIGKSAYLVYSPDVAGVKEDLILTKSIGNKAEFAYNLDLPKELEARVLDDGSLGVYTADTTLYGNISFGSDKDKALVDKARQNGKKENLQFIIPAPVIKQTGKDAPAVQAAFALDGQKLTVKVSGLEHAHYPLTIDPSAFTTTGVSFGAGNNEGGVDTGSNLTRRMSGGGLGSWSNYPSFNTPRWSASAVVYNNFIYILGGCIATNCQITPTVNVLNDVQYAPINPSNGLVGAWASAVGFQTSRWGATAVAHNGFLYVIGGCSGGGSANYMCSSATQTLATVQYAKIDAGGSLSAPSPCAGSLFASTWCSATSFSTGRYEHTSVVATVGVISYLYVIGGCSLSDSAPITGACSTFRNDVQYTKLDSSGNTVDPGCGTVWCTAGNTFTSPRRGHTSFFYTATNGSSYVSVLGGNGCGGASGVCSDFQFAQVDGTNGSLGVWALSTNIMSGRYGHTGAVINGYIYAMGGCSSGNPCSTSAGLLDTVQSAQITSNGDIGVWSSSQTSFSAKRYRMAGATNGNIFYMLGGDGAGQCQSSSTNACSDVQYTKQNTTGGTLISPTCSLGNPVWCGSGNFTQGPRQGHVSFVNTAPDTGTTYIYLLGGETSSGISNQVLYTSILSNGWLAEWATTTPLTNARSKAGGFVYNGYAYILGGETTGNACQAGTSNYCNDVQYAKFNSADGTLGTWKTTTSFTTARRSFGATVYNGYAYITGGFDGTNSLKTTMKAKINPDGSIPASGTDTWTSATDLPAIRRNFQMLAYNSYLYVVAGCTNACSVIGDFLTDVQKAAVDKTTGVIGSWTPACISLCFSARADPAVTIINGYMYVSMGQNNSGPITDLATNAAAINADGSLGIFNAEAVIGVSRSGHTLAAFNNRLYEMGGCISSASLVCSSYVSQVQSVTINSAGSLGNFLTTTALPSLGVGSQKYFDTAAVNYNDKIYVIGGCKDYDTDPDLCKTSEETVFRAGLSQAGGVNTAWDTSSKYTPLAINAVSRHAAVAYNGYIYIIGGMISNTTAIEGTYVSDILVSKLDASGVLGAWGSAGNNLPIAMGEMKATVYNNYLYVFGGCRVNYNTTDGDNRKGMCNTRLVDSTPTNPTPPSKDIYSFKINTDGTLAAAAPLTNKIPKELTKYSIATTGNYVYLSGGEYSQAAQNEVYRYTFTETGGISNNVLQANSLPFNSSRLLSFIHNSQLYVVGYVNSYKSQIDLSASAADSLGVWTTTTGVVTNVANKQTDVVLYHGFVYLPGGRLNGSATLNVGYARIHNGGSGGVSPWSATTVLPSRRQNAASVAVDGKLYVLGGVNSSNTCGGSDICNTVLMATLDASGALTTQTCPGGGAATTWCTLTALPSARRSHTVQVFTASSGQKYMYVIGGCSISSVNCSGILSDVQMAKVNSDGSLGTWQSQTALPAGRFAHSAGISNGYLYVVGGCTNTDSTGCIVATASVLRAQPGSDGSISAWTTITALPNEGSSVSERYDHSMTIYNGNIYVIGGRVRVGSTCPSSTTALCDTIFLGKINASDGTVTWSITKRLQKPLYAHSSLASNGFLNVFAGAADSPLASQSAVYYASINQDGSLGYWNSTRTPATATQSQSAASYNGYFYLIGGLNEDKINYTGQQAIARTGKYSILRTTGTINNPLVANGLLDFCGASNNEGFLYNGTIPTDSNVSMQYRLAGQNDTWRGPTTSFNTVFPGIGVGLSGTGRAIFASITVDDSQKATFPEDSTNQSVITTMSFNYRYAHPKPAQRLRHGTFFTSEEKEVLDTNPVNPLPTNTNSCASI